MKLLIKLNQGYKFTPIYLTLLRKNVNDGEHKDFDEGDHNVNNFLFTINIVHKGDVVILKTVLAHHNLTVPHRIYEVVQDNKDER